MKELLYYCYTYLSSLLSRETLTCPRITLRYILQYKNIIITIITRQSKGRLYPRRCFFKNILFFSQPDWYFEPDQNCTQPLVKNGKIGNTCCLIGNLNILGYMHIVSMRTALVPCKMVIHQCIRKL